MGCPCQMAGLHEGACSTVILFGQQAVVGIQQAPGTCSTLRGLQPDVMSGLVSRLMEPMQELFNSLSAVNNCLPYLNSMHQHCAASETTRTCQVDHTSFLTLVSSVRAVFDCPKHDQTGHKGMTHTRWNEPLSTDVRPRCTSCVHCESC